MNYEDVPNMDWKDAVRIEGACSIVREMGEGWWLFERSTTEYGYNGLLGWDYSYGNKNKFFAKHDPARLVLYNAAKFGLENEKANLFTDGRQVKWITRAFFPPIAGGFAKMAIKQLGALEQKDIDDLERIHGKLIHLLNPGSTQHKGAMKMAKQNRNDLKKKWKIPTCPTAPEMPENVAKTVKLLNGQY